jgi:hypothetical protein
MGDNKPTSFSQYSRRRNYSLKEDTIFDYAGTHHSRVLKLFESPNPHPSKSTEKKLLTRKHNRIFHLRFYLPKSALISKRPEIREVVIMFNGLNETDRFDLYDVLGQHFAERGIAAVLLPTPFHLNRCPPEKPRHAKHAPPHKLMFRNPMLLFHNYKQSMLDSDLLIRKLRNEAPDDKDFGFYKSLFAPNPRISILGFSLGGLRALASFMHDPAKYHTCIIFNSGVQLRLLNTSFLKIKKTVWDKFVSKLQLQEQQLRPQLAHDPYWERFAEVYLGNSHKLLEDKLLELSHRLLFILSGGDQIVPPDHLKDIETEGHGLTSLKIAGVGHVPTADPRWTYWMDRVAEFIIRFVRSKQDVWSGQNIIDEVANLLAGSAYLATLNKSATDFGLADLQQLLDGIPSEHHSSLLRLFYASIAYYPSFREVLNGVFKQYEAAEKTAIAKAAVAGTQQ